MSALTPAPAITPPINPPNSEWEELDGMPNRQVISFQSIAASVAATITGAVTSVEITRPDPIVFATAVPNRNGPINSAMAATVNACLGCMAREETTVATTLALL